MKLGSQARTVRGRAGNVTAAMCAGKQAFDRMDHARAAARRMGAKVHRCPTCRKLHLTHGSWR